MSCSSSILVSVASSGTRFEQNYGFFASATLQSWTHDGNGCWMKWASVLTCPHFSLQVHVKSENLAIKISQEINYAKSLYFEQQLMLPVGENDESLLLEFWPCRLSRRFFFFSCLYFFFAVHLLKSHNVVLDKNKHCVFELPKDEKMPTGNVFKLGIAASVCHTNLIYDVNEMMKYAIHSDIMSTCLPLP